MNKIHAKRIISYPNNDHKYIGQMHIGTLSWFIILMDTSEWAHVTNGSKLTRWALCGHSHLKQNNHDEIEEELSREKYS